MRNPTPLALAALLLGTPVSAQVAVPPTSQSEPDPSITGGVLQDVALWVSPGAPGSSLFLTAYNSPNSGLVTFGVGGEQLDAELPDGPMSAVAVRDDFPLSGVQQTLAVAASINLNGLVAYTVDPDRADRVVRVGAGAFVTGTQFSAVALHQDEDSGRFHVFAGTPTGVLQQYELAGDTGSVTATLVRTLTTTGPIAGLAVDEASDSLFVTQQGQGLWRYAASADADVTGQQLAIQGTGGLSNNVGRVALYRARGGEGYLLVADTGADAFAVYERRARTFVGAFRLADDDGGVIRANDPVALAVSASPLGTAYPEGLFVGSDAFSNPQRFLYARWPAVAEAFDPALRIDTRSDSDGGTDGGTDGGSGDGGGTGGPGPLPPPGVSPPADSGCSCASASVPATAAFALLALVRVGRRRRD
ncbi:phytase [Myxococcus sp. AM009]|uniref:myxosortase-dependent phytase-like phosphatase n=1 Tax=unclassified Myxococcus TaxID=2648731 RepID=UPI001595F312|nr:MULTISPECIES: myxosortase-dependent phytase-like phosphatase [unclassified Myxococcus]NVI99600.1 phytase [Myxococcus sp. AM009]NVJ17100.1 phytase [Myxococcus sp. AM010]